MAFLSKGICILDAKINQYKALKEKIRAGKYLSNDDFELIEDAIKAKIGSLWKERHLISKKRRVKK
jgi:hypothetical protein